MNTIQSCIYILVFCWLIFIALLMSGRGKGRKKTRRRKLSLTEKKIHGILLTDIYVIHEHFQIYVFRQMTWFSWLRENGLISNILKCHCGKTCALRKRSKTTDGYSFRRSSGHQFGMRKYSIFQGSSYDIPD